MTVGRRADHTKCFAKITNNRCMCLTRIVTIASGIGLLTQYKRRVVCDIERDFQFCGRLLIGPLATSHLAKCHLATQHQHACVATESDDNPWGNRPDLGLQKL